MQLGNHGCTALCVGTPKQGATKCTLTPMQLKKIAKNKSIAQRLRKMKTMKNGGLLDQADFIVVNMKNEGLGHQEHGVEEEMQQQQHQQEQQIQQRQQKEHVQRAAAGATMIACETTIIIGSSREQKEGQGVRPLVVPHMCSMCAYGNVLCHVPLSAHLEFRE